jgi:hypothetical protein
LNKFLIFIIVSYIFISPFYLFPSGLPQPADIIVAFGAFVFLFSKKFRDTIKVPIVKHLFRFILLVSIINICYWFYYYALNGIPNTMYFVPLFYIFNGVFFLIFIATLYKDGLLNKQYINIISFTILITLGFQFFLALIGFQFGTGEESSRATLFFNNPNQLGYFSLLMLSLFTVLPSIFRKNIFIIFLVIFITSYLVLYAGSRAALGGVLILTVLLFYFEGFRLKLKSFIFLLIGIIAIPILLQNDFITNNIESLQNRGERFVNYNITEAQIRGYDRFWIHPEYILYGAGEGRFDRFDSYHQMELHSGFGTILFSYGILGFLLFFIFFFKVLKKRLLFYLVLLTPVLFYNLTHQGLRTTLFWALLASIYLVSSNENKIKNE